jgi:hypothetical protein
MTTDYRAELQRLVQAYDEHGGKWPDAHEQALFQAVEAARATLAQPEPQRPTVMEIVALADEVEEEGLGQVDLVRRALARWGRPVIKPVPGADAIATELDPA